MTKVSIILPTYDVENYIEECINSITNQSLKEIEIICVDDGSTDNTAAIIKNLKGKDGRIRLIKQEHAGVSVARNLGIDEAIGEYLYFMDSDDYIVGDMLKTLYDLAKKDDLDDICFNGDSFYDSEELEEAFPEYNELYIRPPKYEKVVTGREFFAKAQENGDYTPVPWLHMVKRELVKNHNIRFFPGVPHADNLFSMEVYLVAKRVKHIAQSLYRRRVREGSISTKKKAFINSYGYFACASAFVKFAKDQPPLTSIENEAFTRRCNILQSVSAKFARGLEKEELENGISGLPFDVQLEYRMIVKNLVVSRRKTTSVQKSKEYRLGSALLSVPKKIKAAIRMILTPSPRKEEDA